MKRANSFKQSALDEIQKAHRDNDIKYIDRIVFSFQFHDSNQGAKISSLTHNQLKKLFDKLECFCGNSRGYWEKQACGKHGKILSVYGRFPEHSTFSYPKHVPDNVEWARFRLEWDFRLVGFFISDDTVERIRASRQVFYIVFIDPTHSFYDSGG